MNIVSLSCRNCGAPLQINEQMEQLACGHCGAQMVEALGSIRTGAVQTAAELALVRLQKELNDANREVYALERGIDEGTITLTHCTFKERDIMSEKAVASAHERAKTLESEIDLGCGFISILSSVLIVVCILAAHYFGSMWWLIPFAFIAVILGNIIYGIRKDGLEKSLKEVKEQIARHLIAIANREASEKATSTISQANEKLPDARASVARIETEIAHNKKIVSLKH
jgi:predicted RNA-binding Zn-ribbon protein involved in translation (DUF1610 family)